MEIQMGEGVFEPGNPDGRGAQAVLEIQVERGGGGQKTVPSVVGVWITSGITQFLSMFIPIGQVCSQWRLLSWYYKYVAVTKSVVLMIAT